MATRIRVRRDTSANWASENPVLASGEFGFDTDTGEVKVGNGTDPWDDLVALGMGGGAVDSVNGDTGVVVLGAADVGADPAGTASGLVSTEATARAAADTALDGRLDVIEALGPLATDVELAAEASTRAAADSALDTRVDALEAGGSGAGLPGNIITATSNATAAVGDLVLADATSAGFTVTLPTNPAVGSLVTVKKVDGTGNDVTVVPAGGGTVDGDVNATITDPDFGGVFEHVGSDDWQIVSVTSSGGSNGVDGADGADGAPGADGADGADGVVQSVVAGTGITVDSTDPANPIVAASGGGGGLSMTATLAGHTGAAHRSGRWYDGGVNNLARPSTALSANFLYVHPFYVPRAVSIDRLGVNVTAGAAVAARVGLYASNASGLPDALVFEAGSTLDLSTTGGKEVTVSQALTADTLYWLAIVVSVNGASISGLAPGSWASRGFAALTDTSPPNRGYVVHAYGAMPSSFGTATFDTSNVGAVRARIV